MRKLFIFLLFVTILSCGDEESNSICGVANPIEDLPWLKSMIQDIEASDFGQYTYIQQAYYFGQPVFIVNNCCPFCLSIVPVYNCEGELVCNLGECVDNLITHEKFLWAPANSSCVFS